MYSLVARNLIRPHTHRRKWPLEEGTQLYLGRKVGGQQLQADWDELIADRHAIVQLRESKLHIYSYGEGDNRQPIYYDGQRVDEFTLLPGEGFVIGRTTFRFFAAPPETDPSPGPDYSTPKSNPLAGILELLEKPLRRQLDVKEFQSQIVEVLCQRLAQADKAAILHAQPNALQPLVSKGDLGICEPFVREVIKIQSAGEVGWTEKHRSNFAAVPGAAWAYCIPVFCDPENYAIYLSGKSAAGGASSSASGLKAEEINFIKIVAGIFQWVRSLEDLRRCRDDMEGFFPKQIRNLLRSNSSKEVFKLEEAPAAILFCDLRGSSRFAEQRAAHLTDAWKGIQDALKIMTVAITSQNGCIGDFQGDAAMAFWGWPRRAGAGDNLPESVTRACQAADTLREQFHQLPVGGLKCGIGIAAGDVVAGMLGTKDQRKIGVFGPVVNLAARLESLTKRLEVSILIDEQAHDALHSDTSDLAAGLFERVRFLAAIQPAGMDTAVRVYELMPPPAENPLPVSSLRLFDVGRDAFANKDWSSARKTLRNVAAAGDGPARFLLQWMDKMITPPANWDGRIVLAAK
jgi:adenylate cyclase